jgi:hypothetical protein
VGETIGGGFETLRGDKTHGFISTTRSLQNKQKLLIHALSFLSSISILSLPHTDNSINLVAYLYTN